MAEDDPEKRTFLQKLLFYTTAFFILLGIFSLFAFLFLVPFVIEPAFTTIFMEFDPVAALCQTMDREQRFGVSNCSWSSCREGCTKEVFACTQLRVNYKLVDPPPPMSTTTSPLEEENTEEPEAGEDEESLGSLDATRWDRRKSRRHVALRSRAGSTEGLPPTSTAHPYLYGNVTQGAERKPRATKDYDYFEEDVSDLKVKQPDGDLDASVATGLMGNNSEWFYIGAQFFPNVKGCGYPPMLNCTIWLKKYETPGTNFSCYYSKIDPGKVISDLDMHQVYMNLVFAIAIPVPSFIISVIYMTIAYFKIYNEEETEALVPPEDTGAPGELDATTPVPALTSGAITPGSEAFREDLASFGHQLKVAMADEMSRESIADSVPAALNTSNSIPGNLTKTMTTSISTPPGPIAAV